MRLRLPPGGISSNMLLLVVVAFLVAAGNQAFFAHVLATYPPAGNLLKLLSLTAGYFAVTALVAALFAFGRLTKPVLILLLVLSAPAAYFMDSYDIVINTEMLENVVQTNVAEARDLLTFKLLAYLSLLGLLPAWLVWRTPVRWAGWRREILSRIGLMLLLVVVIVGAVASSSRFYASFLREHKALRSYANPTYYLTAVTKFAAQQMRGKTDGKVREIALDARKLERDAHRELVILVVGETARADRFSINGYPRETTPYLERGSAISLRNFWACGTSTAVSVPCMFSHEGMERFDVKEASSQENLLDVLQRVGTHVLWLDNNSDSKGVALRVPYQSFKSAQANPLCDEECRDEGMLVSLQSYIDSHPEGDIFIVLHQMGNHGPAYYKRYPPDFERYRPACQSNDLSQCSVDEIGNAYDNAILYTDYFLGKVIALLKQNDARFETAMFYVSDHGESLGEGGAYLHGMPRAIAPDSQLHVPAVLWFGSRYDEIDLAAVMKKRDQRFTHDNLFHTVLGLLEINTSLYRPDLDILAGARRDF